MQEESTYIVPIYKGTYENISEAYQSLHKSFYYETRMDMTRQQAAEAQRQVAKTYARLSGVPELSTLVVINMLYDMLLEVISNISPSMKYIIDPEDIRRMDSNRRMFHSVICNFNIHPILMSSYRSEEYQYVLMFACSKNGNRYNLYIFYCDSYDSSYIGFERGNIIVFKPAYIKNALQKLEQMVSSHICQFAAKKICGDDLGDRRSFHIELLERFNNSFPQ